MAEKPRIDPIVEEVRRARDTNAAKFGYDVDAIFADLQRRQEQIDQPLVSCPPRRPAAPPREGAA